MISVPAGSDAHDAVLHRDGDSSDPVSPFYGKGQPGAAAIPEDPVEREDIRGCGDGLSEETFFPPFESEPGITHNADNSGTAGGYARSL